MELRPSDIVAHRINWRPKWIGIQEICEELSLALESVLFIDDNPVEREAVHRNLPAVKVLDLPSDPAGFADSVKSCIWLESVIVTKEDLRRVKGYQHRAKIENGRRKAANLDDFYASLGMKLHLHQLSDGNIARAAQLCQKTNQFNTTTTRYNQRDLRNLVQAGADVIMIGLEDKTSELENIGLLILKPSDERQGWGSVDNYLLSCRILGRGVETSVLYWALARARARGWKGLHGRIIETERNTPARQIFRDAGFAAGVPGHWQREAQDVPPLSR
jgi:FkbH-like protein